MRYTTIHHEVREHFNLSMAIYGVIDSISQISTTSNPNRSNVTLAKFLGIDESTVREAKKIGLSKGLLVEKNGEWRATTVWTDSVTYATKPSDSGKSRIPRENPEKTRENPEHSIYNNNNNSKSAAKAAYSIEEVETKQRSKAKPSYEKMLIWLRDLTGAPLKDVGKQYKYLKLAEEYKYSPDELRRHAEKLWDDSWFRSHGMDWKTVVDSIDKTRV